MSLIGNTDSISITVINTLSTYTHYEWTAARGGFNGITQEYFVPESARLAIKAMITGGET